MKKRLILLLMIGLQHAGICFAQWTEKDSLWLENILSGKEKLELAPEVKKAIESGTFIDMKNHRQELSLPPSQYTILKEFEGIGIPDTMQKHIDYRRMPPSVFSLYFMPDSFGMNELQSFYIPTQPGASYAPTGLGLVIVFSAEDAMRYIFWPSHRAKKRNRKNATAWKWYNMY